MLFRSYTATSTDSGDISGGVTHTLEGTDSGFFTVNASTGAVTLVDDPNYEGQSSYAFTVVARDAAGNSTSQDVTLAINNLDEVAPSITSGGVAAAIDENSGAGQVVYTATSTDSGDISGGVTYSLSGADAGFFSVNGSTGAVTLTGDPNYEGRSSYAFTVVARDAAGNSSAQDVTLAINNLDEVAPSITSGGVADAIDEKSGAGQVVYVATSTDSGDISGGVTYSLSGDDAGEFTIDSSTGAVTLVADPDRKSTRLNSSHVSESRMPSSA